MALRRTLKDQVFLDHRAAPAALQDWMAVLENTFEIDLTDILVTNLTGQTVQDEDSGEQITIPPLGLTDDNLIAIGADPATIGSIVLVVTYQPETKFIQPVPTEAPLAIPERVYVLNMPKAADILTGAKLTDVRDDLLSRFLLAAGRKTVKTLQDGKGTLIADPIGALLAVAGSRGDKADAAFDAMFTGIQHTILSQAKNMIDKLRKANQHGKARDMAAVFTAARFNRANVKAAMRSKAAAEYHFPTFPQKQWENLLLLCANSAPKFAPPVTQRDEAGKALKGPDGKTIKTITPRPQSPAFFLQCIATRDSAAFTPPTAGDEELPVMTFDGLSI